MRTARERDMQPISTTKVKCGDMYRQTDMEEREIMSGGMQGMDDNSKVSASQGK